MADFSYEILDHLGELSKSKSDWTKELTQVSWNGQDPVYDIRSWSPDHEKMGKGVTFTKEELTILRDTLNQLDL